MLLEQKMISTGQQLVKPSIKLLKKSSKKTRAQRSILLFIYACFMLGGCSSANLESTLIPFRSIAGIEDFGDPNSNKLKQKARQLEAHSQDESTETLIITQLGDSHSAADFFTGKIRNLMQAHFGNAGIGWVPPMTISGQYHTAVKWEDKNWQLTSSRNKKADFPLGGFIASSETESSLLKLIPTVAFDSDQKWLVKFWTKGAKTSRLFIESPDHEKHAIAFTQSPNKWFATMLSTTLPMTLIAQKEVELGGFWLQKKNKSGVILSSIATNGAQLSILDKWSPIWKTQLQAMQSDLIILEFGTNEAFNDVFSEESYRAYLVKAIKELRTYSPSAAILLLSPPDTFAKKDSSLSCDERYPAHFNLVKQIQLDVAQSEKTLYWDWQKAMGGSCTIDKWAVQKLAQKDFVHLTRAGYEKTATIFYEDFLDFIAPFKLIHH